MAALRRALIKALEAQGRGFAHGHEQIHSEPMTKAIDLILALCGPDAAGEHSEARLRSWMKEHRAAVLKDACSKQYDIPIEACRSPARLRRGFHCI